MAFRFIAIIVMLVMAVSATPVLAQSPEPLEIEGEPMTNLVTSHPLPTTFAVTSSSGVYVGKGSSWSSTKASVPAPTLVWGGDESAIWLAGEAADCMMSGGTAPMQRSDDNGDTWADIPGTEGLSPLGLWPTTGAALAAGCAGVFGSRDHGQTWTTIPELPAGFEVTSAGEVLSDTPEHHVMLLGLTGEGGTSSLYAVDLSDPESPVVTPDLRTYYAVGALAGKDDTFVLGATDGVWVSPDAGKTWERRAEGLETLVLAEDPAVAGLPENLDPQEFGISAVSPVPGERGGIVVGTSDGLYLSPADGEPFVKLAGTAGRVDQIQIHGETGEVLYLADDHVFHTTLPES